MPNSTEGYWVVVDNNYLTKRSKSVGDVTWFSRRLSLFQQCTFLHHIRPKSRTLSDFASLYLGIV